MKIAISADSRDSSLLSQMKSTLGSLNIDLDIIKDSNYKLANEVDLVLAAGGDRGILDYFHKVVTDSAPVLGVYESDSTGFLAQVSLRDLEMKSSKISRGNYEIDEVVRLAVKVDGNDVQPVLNDV